MRTDELISVREYLSTSYDPDCDYVDGVVVERNVGEKDHGKLQKALIMYFEMRRREWGTFVIQEQRVQVSPTRFRIPDVCVVLGPEPSEQIFTTPPFICIEVLSPEDRMAAMQERVDDYMRMGVSYVWIINPRNRKAYRGTSTGFHEVTELRTENPEMAVPLEALFEE
ncbi:MAG TPA: Uma2 family endonuclease [Bryobacteraceae bacterium]|nr:Uma2 family endonuclease [Bryobacteraceae bacterium]